MNDRPRIIFLPGMGADARLLEPQRALQADIEVPPWIEPRRRESLAGYAERFAKTLDVSRPFILGGVSFGGMVAIELTRHVEARGLIMLSSCRSRAGIPRLYRCMGLSAYVVPLPIITMTKAAMPVVRRTFGITTAAQQALINEMLADMPPKFLRWSIQAVLSWRGVDAVSIPTIHIHGKNDRILPTRLGNPDHCVTSAGHLMNVTHADEVNALLSDWLRRTWRN